MLATPWGGCDGAWMHRSHSPLLTAALVVTSALAPMSAFAAPRPAASASYGQAEVVLQKDPARAGRLQLAYRADADAPLTAVDVRLPAGIKARGAAVGLGLDATGLLTAVVKTPRGLVWAHVTRPADGVHRLARTAGAESPAIFKGRVAYVCHGGKAICKASLRTRARSVVYRERRGSSWQLQDVRIGAGDALAIGAERDGALGASRVQLLRAGGKPKTVAEANFDELQSVFVRDVSPAGDHVNVVERTYSLDSETAEEVIDRLLVFTLPGGESVL